MITRRSLLLFAALLGVAAGSDVPDFSGRWNLNPAKSDYRGLPAPSQLTRTVEHNDPELKISTTQSGAVGGVTTDLVYTTDGKECTNTVRGAEVKGSAQWDGDVLEIRSKRLDGIQMIERWSLSADGKTLTINAVVDSTAGSVNLVLVLER